MTNSLRSQKWFRRENEIGHLHWSALASAVIDRDNYNGQPLIGIANTWGEVNAFALLHKIKALVSCII